MSELESHGSATRFSWCVLADVEWRFVYSPRLGAAYKLDHEQVENDVLLRLLGLRQILRVDSVEDPAVRVGLGGRFEKEICPADVMTWIHSERGALLRWLPRWYRLFHRHRHIFTPLRVNRLARIIALLIKPQNLTVDRIAKLVAATECQAGFSDCYPRALLTSGLCTMAGLQSNITIGILAPTRKLHAWCTSDGTLIYEPTPRHWWYRPLADFRFGPAAWPRGH